MDSKVFISKFRKIKLKYICKRIKVNYYNILNGRASRICYDKLKNELDKEIINLYKDDIDE
jgi:hypothetical protein